MGSGDDDGSWQLNDVARRTDDSLVDTRGPYINDVCTGRGVAQMQMIVPISCVTVSVRGGRGQNIWPQGNGSSG